ncbi:MAG: hypothetical protein JXR51_06055 [Bacteroidales bacterium]|nr:hypothetical protein [Bacteroidales bacterium]MBN2756724.1 hypothetical protein [Bacteroidales bacterium]
MYISKDNFEIDGNIFTLIKNNVYMNKALTILIFLILFIITPVFVQTAIAQPPPPGPTDIPIDGGLGFLLAAGIGYAAKKLYSQRENPEK